MLFAAIKKGDAFLIFPAHLLFLYRKAVNFCVNIIFCQNDEVVNLCRGSLFELRVSLMYTIISFATKDNFSFELTC